MKKSKILLVLIIFNCLFICPSLFAQKEQGSKEAKGIIGNWKIVTEQNGRQMSNRLSISEKEDGTLRIRWNEGIQDDRIADVNFTDNKLTFTRTIYMGEWEIDTDFEAVLKDDKLTGKIISERGQSPFTGSRIIPKPDCIGIWQVTTAIADKEQQSDLIISRSDKGQLEGKWLSRQRESRITNIKFDKGKLTFERIRLLNEKEVKTPFTGFIKDNQLKGEFEMQSGEMAATLTGKRKGSELIGRWDLITQTDNGEWNSTLWVEKDLAAEYGTGFGNSDVNDLKLADGKVTFNVTFGFGDRDFKIDFDLKIDGDKIKGQSSSSMGTSEISGRKIIPKPARKEDSPAEKDASKQ